jgi:cytochrome c oxidase subunit 4
MSTTTATEDVHPAGEAHAHDHPTDFSYVKIALLLAAITALEVGSYFYKDATTTFLVITLLPMMTAKFLIVTGYFMHLKYDNKLFRRVFFFGLILATVVFLIMLSTFAFWGDDYFKYLKQ